MDHWWRAYDSAVDHEKLLLLSDKAHRAWFNLMCLASAYGGVLPDIKVIAVKLRITAQRAAAVIAELVAAGLFERREDGKFEPRNWSRRQFKMDAGDQTNAARQKKFRERHAEERRQLLALLNSNTQALRNGVSNVTAKRPDTDTERITTTISVERGQGLPRKISSIPVSPEFAEAMGKK